MGTASTGRNRPPDQGRRRLIVGLGALGVGALGAGVFGNLGGSGEVGNSQAATTSTRQPSTTAEAPQTTSSAPVAVATRPPETAAIAIPETTATSEIAASLETVLVVAARQAWGAKPASAGMIEHAPVRLTLHHTAVSQTALNQGPARARQHQQYHQSLGWPDLAYHFLVDGAGMAYQGRDVRYRGDTGTEYDPTGHFLVCMEGDFDSQKPSVPQVEATVLLFAWAAQQFGVEAATLAGHGAYASTSCPGSFVTELIPDMTIAVAESPAVTLDVRCGPAGSELVADVETG